MPRRGVEKAATSPGSVKLAGIITVTPCTFGKRRSAIRSFATPFWTQKTGCSATPAARSRSSADAVSWVFMVRRTASSGRQSISPGSATQGKRARAAPSGVRSRSPPARTASSWAPRAMPATSRPASASAAATVPPIAPMP